MPTLFVIERLSEISLVVVIVTERFSSDLVSVLKLTCVENVSVEKGSVNSHGAPVRTLLVVF